MNKEYALKTDCLHYFLCSDEQILVKKKKKQAQEGRLCSGSLFERMQFITAEKHGNRRESSPHFATPIR